MHAMTLNVSSNFPLFQLPLFLQPFLRKYYENEAPTTLIQFHPCYQSNEILGLLAHWKKRHIAKVKGV